MSSNPLKKTFSGKDWLGAGLTGGMSLFFTGNERKSKMPEAPGLPPEVEEIDTSAQVQMRKKRLQSKKGRQSTILGSSYSGGNTLLG